jgi:uncharacterized protein with ParB-like and HNH nuclease domain
MSSELKNLSELFQNRLFRIPDYQRGYAWKHEQLVDFWEDLLNLHEGRYHYTGLLSLKGVKAHNNGLWGEDEWLIENGFSRWHVVDGQQRLTTFSILMNEIVNLVQNIDDNKDKQDDSIYLGYESLRSIKEKYILKKRPQLNLVTTYIFGYETDNPSSDYLKYKVFDEPFGGTVFETYYTKNLKYAKIFFAENLEEMFKNEGLEGIARIYKKLTLRLMFNLHEIKDDYDVFVAFETMNNRGKKLTNLELLKNRLIYLTTLFDDKQCDQINKEKLRKNINDAWKEVYFQLGRNQDAPLSDDDFLRTHWITYFQYSRKRGDDYIRFLLNKFSAKNVFEKFTIITQTNGAEPLSGFESTEDDDPTENSPDLETITVSKLAPMEISDYVNSLKVLAEYWYYSFFPYDSKTLSDREKVQVDKLNRVGIGYFRPLVVSILATSTPTSENDRVELLQTIERFIFLSFRIGGFNSSYLSSDYNNKAREIIKKTIKIKNITKGLNDTIKADLKSIVASFISRTSRRFDSGEGFYGWRDLRYFLFEYEYKLSIKNSLEKVDWNMFTKVEKDKVTIEHILPQTATKWYWKNQFRQYSDTEIKLLSASLGNLLPLSQSINSSLQNDGFYDKKKVSTSGRRGYMNGSHSEIEVALEEDWTARNILNRGLKLLGFMEERWSFQFTIEQKMELLHINFVNEDRPDVPEIIEKKVVIQKPQQIEQKSTSDLSELEKSNYQFWSNFCEYCILQGRENDIAARKPKPDNFYDIPLESTNYHIFFQLVYKKFLRIGIYLYQKSDFDQLVKSKDEIETLYGSSLEWFTSKEQSAEKRILHTIETDIYNPTLYTQHFDWLIFHFDKPKYSLLVTNRNIKK